MISLIIFFPALAACLGFFIDDKNAKTYGIFIAALELIFTLCAWYIGDFSEGYTLMQNFSLISSLSVSYLVGADGISIFLVILAALVSLIALANADSNKRLTISILAFEASMIGAFLSLDGILFYLFWELNLIPMFYLIGFYKKSEASSKAAFKFFVYGFSGSVFLLLGIIYMAYLTLEQSGVFSFNMLFWSYLSIPKDVQIWLFLAFGVSFAVKSPIFPFHTWLLSSHKEAPTTTSMLLALKLGTYGFIRFSLPFFPDASVYFYPLIASLAIITIIYAAFIAFAQEDIKMIIAYSSISHAGMVVLSIFSLSIEGVAGAVYLMVAHGLIGAILFMLIGILSKQRQSRLIKDFGGVAKSMPIFASIFGLCMLSSIGLPLTAGFVGEFLALLAAFKLSAWLGFFGGVAIIVGAIYMLHLFREVIFGQDSGFKFKELCASKATMLLAICLLVIALGVYPSPLLNIINQGANNTISKMIDTAAPQAKELLSKLNQGAAQ